MVRGVKEKTTYNYRLRDLHAKRVFNADYARETETHCDGKAISTDERACVLIRTLRPAVRGGTDRFCRDHARGTAR